MTQCIWEEKILIEIITALFSNLDKKQTNITNKVHNCNVSLFWVFSQGIFTLALTHEKHLSIFVFCNVAIFFFITDLFCQIHHKHKSTVRWNTNKALTTTLDYRFTCATCSLTNRKGGNFVCLKTIVSLFSPECSKCCSSFMLLNKWGSKKYNYYYCSVGISLCYRPSMRADVCLNSVCSLLGKVTPLSVCVCAYVHYLCAELSPFIPRHVCEMSLLCKHDVLIIHVMYWSWSHSGSCSCLCEHDEHSIWMCIRFHCHLQNTALDSYVRVVCMHL